MMKKLLFLIIAVIFVFISCDKDENTNPYDKSTIKGTWNESFIKRYNIEGVLVSEESMDTIRLIKKSIDDFIIQEMLIDTAHTFFYLMYSSYEYENGVLQRYPDSLIDIDMNKYYWNEEDSAFGNLPMIVYPSQGTIDQIDNAEIIENRVFEHGSIDITYIRLNEMSVDLKKEFENYSNNLKLATTDNSKLISNNKSKGDNMVITPVYNKVYKTFGE